MAFEKGHQRIEPTLTQADVERIWELFFGSKFSLGKIAQEYAVRDLQVISVIDGESQRRWRKKHPHETNRERFVGEE